MPWAGAQGGGAKPELADAAPVRFGAPLRATLVRAPRLPVPADPAALRCPHFRESRGEPHPCRSAFFEAKAFGIDCAALLGDDCKEMPVGRDRGMAAILVGVGQAESFFRDLIGCDNRFDSSGWRSTGGGRYLPPSRTCPGGAGRRPLFRSQCAQAGSGLAASGVTSGSAAIRRIRARIAGSGAPAPWPGRSGRSGRSASAANPPGEKARSGRAGRRPCASPARRSKPCSGSAEDERAVRGDGSPGDCRCRGADRTDRRSAAGLPHGQQDRGKLPADGNDGLLRAGPLRDPQAPGLERRQDAHPAGTAAAPKRSLRTRASPPW